MYTVHNDKQTAFTKMTGLFIVPKEKFTGLMDAVFVLIAHKQCSEVANDMLSKPIAYQIYYPSAYKSKNKVTI